MNKLARYPDCAVLKQVYFKNASSFVWDCFDSAPESGLDILKVYRLEPDFPIFGRVWHYDLRAMGSSNPNHKIKILEHCLIANMQKTVIKDLNKMEV